MYAASSGLSLVSTTHVQKSCYCLLFFLHFHDDDQIDKGKKQRTNLLWKDFTLQTCLFENPTHKCPRINAIRPQQSQVFIASVLV